jgi:hypothetical protein
MNVKIVVMSFGRRISKMSKQLTQAAVRRSVRSFVRETKQEFDADTNRETLMEWIDENCDSIWGNLVKMGRIDQYDVDDLVETASECATIIKTAKDDAWVEDDRGLWEGLTYGLVASIAYFSLRNLLYQGLKNAGIDSNNDYPLKVQDG